MIYLLIFPLAALAPLMMLSLAADIIELIAKAFLDATG